MEISPWPEPAISAASDPITGWNPQSVGMNRKRALRRWLPNLQPMVVQRNGSPVRIKACSRCIRTAEKV